MSLNRNKKSRQEYQDYMCQFAVDDFVFLDESIFNETTE